jgi:predicted NAD/FAD-dependent oxidoreductase
MNEKADVLIIGAGLAGLMAATKLQQAGLKVQLVDKGSRVGGRLATRPFGEGRADYGAQFFTVRTPVFQEYVDRWLASGLVYVWSTGWADGSLGNEPANDGYPRYAVRGGMNELAYHLAQGLTTAIDERVVTAKPTRDGWVAQGELGQVYTGRALILTPPVPQSLALVAAGGVMLARSDQTALARIVYAPCLAGIFQVEGLANLPEPGAVQQPDSAISWLADNQRKGISPEARVITVHAGPYYSREHWDDPAAAVLATLEAELSSYLTPEAVVQAAQLKRWRYALPTTCHPERFLQADFQPALIFAGDAFGGPRVEGAALSGLTAAEAV